MTSEMSPSQHEATVPWYASAFDEEYYDAFSPMLTPDLTRSETDFLVDKLALPEGARILDLCCGQGRHAIELAKRGYHVTGLDLSTYLLDIAKRDAKAADVDVEFLHDDMRQIPKPEAPYDAVINMFSAYGYLEDDDEDQKSLASAASALRPGGMFLLDTMNREAMVRYWQPFRWTEYDNGTLFLAKMRFDVLTSRQYVTELLVRGDGRRSVDDYSYRVYSYTELARQFRMEGYDEKSLQVWGDFDGSRYTINSPRMIVLARLPG